MEPTLEIEIGEMPEGQKYQVIKFSGEFDKAGQTDIKKQLEDHVKNFPSVVLVFDFTALKFINSEGIGYLMEIHAHLVKGGKKLVIVGPPANIQDVFKAIGIQDVIPVYTDMQSFLNAV